MCDEVKCVVMRWDRMRWDGARCVVARCGVDVW